MIQDRGATVAASQQSNLKSVRSYSDLLGVGLAARATAKCLYLINSRFSALSSVFSELCHFNEKWLVKHLSALLTTAAVFARYPPISMNAKDAMLSNIEPGPGIDDGVCV